MVPGRDGLLAWSLQDVKVAAQILIQGAAERGLRLSTEVTDPGKSKSSVWALVNLGVDPLGLGVMQIQDEGFLHLGCPVGSNGFVEQTLLENVIEKLPTLQDSHCKCVVLRSCFSIPKVTGPQAKVILRQLNTYFNVCQFSLSEAMPLL